MFSALDRAAVGENRSGASRHLAAIADLLSCEAGPDGGLRSGPASNGEWLPALHLLEVRELQVQFMCLVNYYKSVCIIASRTFH